MEHFFIFGSLGAGLKIPRSEPVLYVLRREFLPLPCFDDRDLREAQREGDLSYRQFIDKHTHREDIASKEDVPFGRGKKGQPLKIILRGSDPKADMILDILVSFHYRW